jgi:hypothetical protein
MREKKVTETNKKPKCAACVWFESTGYEWFSVKDRSLRGMMGRCKAKNPNTTTDKTPNGGFREVRDIEWCGDHDPRD